MNMQPGLPSKASTNGSPYIRGEREGVLNKAKSIKSHPANAGVLLIILCDISATSCSEFLCFLIYIYIYIFSIQW